MVEAVAERNRVVHAGTQTISGSELVETLSCVRDLLYPFDYYAGHGWARDNLSERFVGSLGS